jgi:hypothetical protein
MKTLLTVHREFKIGIFTLSLRKTKTKQFCNDLYLREVGSELNLRKLGKKLNSAMNFLSKSLGDDVSIFAACNMRQRIATEMPEENDKVLHLTFG